MIGFVVLSLLAAVTADHLTPYLPYPRVEELRRIYPQEILRNYPFLDHRVVSPHVVHRPFVNTPLPYHPVPTPVLPGQYPFLNRVAPQYLHDIRSPYFRDYVSYPYIDRLPHIPAPAPIVPELPLPAPPAPVISSLDALPSPYPFLPAPTPLVPHTPFTPFIPPSTLVAPLPGLIGEEKVEDKKEMIVEEKKEVMELEPRGEEKFSHEFEDEHGTIVKEEGRLVDNVLIKRGRYSYTSPEGVPVEIKYIADENGYRLL